MPIEVCTICASSRTTLATLSALRIPVSDSVPIALVSTLLPCWMPLFAPAQNEQHGLRLGSGRETVRPRHVAETMTDYQHVVLEQINAFLRLRLQLLARKPVREDQVHASVLAACVPLALHAKHREIG